MYKYLYVWYNLNNDTYYYKLLNHDNTSYYVGFVNQYNHRLLLKDKIVIDKSSFNKFTYLKIRAMRNIITYLENKI